MVKRLPDLFSYVVPSDSGFAPNPYGGLCTLACCEPKIRQYANVSDWIMLYLNGGVERLMQTNAQPRQCFRTQLQSCISI
jgi:hypothetical protein